MNRTEALAIAVSWVVLAASCVELAPVGGGFGCEQGADCLTGWSCAPGSDADGMVCVQGDATSDDAEPEVTVADTVDVGPEATPESFLTGIWRSPGTSQYLFLHLEHSDAQVTGMVGFAADDFHIDFDNGVFADDQLIFSYPVMSRGLPTTATFDLTYYEDSDQLIGTRVIDSNVPDKEIGLTFSRYDP